MVSHPELGSDPPIGLDRESGRDTPSVLRIGTPLMVIQTKVGEKNLK